jgi:uridine phosphorylase
MRYIAPSELILNPDGSVYHLGLRPEDIGATIITVGDPGRVARVSRHFDKVDSRREKREFVTHTGTLAGKRLTVLSSGIGPDNIDIVLNELDALFNIDLEQRRPKAENTSLNIIRIGTSGALQPDLPVGAFIASAYGLGLDNLLHFYHQKENLAEAELLDALHEHLAYMPPMPTAPYIAAGDPALSAVLGAAMHMGITLTAPGFYAPQGRQLRLPSRFSPAMLDELTRFDFRGLPRLLGHRALSCNVMLVNRPLGQFSQEPAALIDRLIEEVLRRVSDSELFK